MLDSERILGHDVEHFFLSVDKSPLENILVFLLLAIPENLLWPEMSDMGDLAIWIHEQKIYPNFDRILSMVFWPGQIYQPTTSVSVDVGFIQAKFWKLTVIDEA